MRSTPGDLSIELPGIETSRNAGRFSWRGDLSRRNSSPRNPSFGQAGEEGLDELGAGVAVVDIEGVIDALGERVTHWLPCSLDGRRAASADLLSARLESRGMKVAARFATPVAALAYAQENAGEDDRILAFGSFLTVAAALQALGRPA